MENATKALLIAAAVLIVIMIIGIALKISNSANGTINQAQTTMSAIEIQTFNARLSPYAGKNKTASEIINLSFEIISIISNNNNSIIEVMIHYGGKASNGNEYKFTLNKNKNLTESNINTFMIQELSKEVNNKKIYRVEYIYSENGLISKINITKQ